MGYYIRVLSLSPDLIPVNVLERSLKSEKLAANLAVETGTIAEWYQLHLSHPDGRSIAVIERNDVGNGLLGSEEIEEFLEDIEECQPTSAASWLAAYLGRVKVIYAFQVLQGTDVEEGWRKLNIVKMAIHRAVGGVLQADNEGFSDDEQGDHILWQFSDNVKGRWRMAVRRGDDWVRFEMDLGNRKHRAAFRRGEVPEGVNMIT